MEQVTIFKMPEDQKQINDEPDFDQSSLKILRENIESIKSICLYGSSYGENACKILSEIFKSGKSVEVIDFSSCFDGRLKDVVC